MPKVKYLDSRLNRRQLIAAATVGGAGLALSPLSSHASPKPSSAMALLTVIGTTDLHGSVFNWDYFRNSPYSDKNSNHIGIAKAASLIKAVRAERGASSCVTIDAGDTIQGTPLNYYYARIEPISRRIIHPMAKAMNAVGYDAAALGNHEFNYGISFLRRFESQLKYPLLAANAVDWNNGKPVFQPYIIKDVQIKGKHRVRVGILGLVTPGVAIWDKANVEGTIRFPGLVEQAKIYVPRMRAAGADVVIVAAHSGATTGSSYGDALPYPENAATLVAEQVPGIDAILVGHAHQEIPQRLVTNKVSGKQVLLTEPLYWGMRVSVIDLQLSRNKGRWEVASANATVLNSNTAPEDPAIAALIQPMHEKVLKYANSRIGTSKKAMSAITSRFEDTPAMDFINHVQADAVKKAIAGTAEASLPVLSIAAPFNRSAAIPAGDVTVRDVAGLYVFDNTLQAIVLTGRQIKAYLEHSAAYFKQVSGPGPFLPDEVTNAPTTATPNGTPDYNYDIMAGLDARLTYDIDIAKPVGSRIANLTHGGRTIADSARFVLAINNYRQSGGGNFPGVTKAPVIYNQQVEIRQLLIDWVTSRKVIDPSTFSSADWRLVSNGRPVTFTRS